MRLFPRPRPPADCRAGAHRYTESHRIGPGIRRHICEHCSAVSIDLTSEESTISHGLFVDREETVPADS